MRRLAFILALLPGLAQAADAHKTYTLVLTPEQTQVVMEGLGEVKAARSMGTINEILRQVSEQSKPAEKPKGDEPPPK